MTLPLQHLPREINELIAEYLPPPDLHTFAQLSHGANAVAHTVNGRRVRRRAAAHDAAAAAISAAVASMPTWSTLALLWNRVLELEDSVLDAGAVPMSAEDQELFDGGVETLAQLLKTQSKYNRAKLPEDVWQGFAFKLRHLRMRTVRKPMAWLDWDGS